MRRGVRAGVALATLSWGLLFTITSHTPVGLYWFSFVGAAWAFVGAGVVADWQRPDSLMGRLMVLTGLLFLPPTLVATRVPVLWSVGNVLASAAPVAMFYVVLAFPRGALTTRMSRALFRYTFAVVLGLTVTMVALFDPMAFGCADCPDGLNLLLVRHDPQLFVDVVKVIAAFILADVLGLAVIVVARFARATQPARRILWPVYIPVVVWCFVHAYTVVLTNYTEALDWTAVTGPLAAATPMVIPVTFLIGLLRIRARRARVGQLVVELGAAPSSGSLREAVARALGDPDVEVGFWDAEGARYVTAAGQPLALPHDETGRAATLLERDGAPLAVIVHDRALLDDPTLLDAVRAATSLAVDNERLGAVVRAQLEEVRASRHRIVAAADAERRRVERDLHDGAQQRLVKLGLTIRLAQARLGEHPDPELQALLVESAAEAQRARTELRDLAQGIHPALLTDDGLQSAIEALVELSPVPVQVTAPQCRYGAAVEAAAYFVVSESLTNVARHSSASRASVTIRDVTSGLNVEVSDDGIGGAQAGAGSGLRGLADRVAALDGALAVDSPPGRGTRIVAHLPCG